MEYEIDKWDLEGSEQLFEPLNRKNKKDLRMVNEYCDEHEFLYGNHTCEPIWEEKTGNLKKYEILILWSLAVPTILFGFYPEPLINTIEVSVNNVIEMYNSNVEMYLAKNNQ